MVGVAGKSKGCNTCRKRKIKCDEARPECGQCRKTGRHCPGYRRDTVFLNQSSTDTAQSSSHESTIGEGSETSAIVHENVDITTKKRGRRKNPESQLVVQLNNQHVFQNRFVAEFLRIYLPTSQNCPQVPLTWLQLVFNIPTEGPALDRALSAVSLSVVGRATNNSLLVVEGSRKYGQALWELQRALWDQQLMYRDETLAASHALVLYELLESTDNNLLGWVAHAQGIARLIEARGPDSFDTPLANMVYSQFRHTMMIQDLQGRKASVFTEAEWQMGPWKKFPKGPDQRLCDIGAELATILARADRSKSTQDNLVFGSERLALLEDCCKLEARLEAWYTQLDMEIPAPHYWVEFSHIRNPVDDREGHKVFPTSFHYPNIYIARVLVDYWALSILLYSTSLLTYRSFVGESKTSGPEHPADSQRAKAKPQLPRGRAVTPPKVCQNPGMIRTCADNIAQSMEYLLSPDMGTLGPQWALFGLRVAMQTYLYSSRGEEHQWSKAIHDMICDEKGLRFSRTIKEYQWETSSSSQAESSDFEAGLVRLTGPERGFGTGVGAKNPSSGT